MLLPHTVPPKRRNQTNDREETNMTKTILGTTVFAAAIIASPAHAGGITLKPNVDARLRYENVDQPATDADALTIRLRNGITATGGAFSVLVEAEGTLAIVDHYRGAPFLPANGYSVVADPENIELNRAQIQYKSKALTLTGGRQRLNIDDQRFVGSVGWRQNEQTFDAVTAEATIGPVALNGTYSWSQRTIFGIDAGPRQAYSGDFVFLGAGTAVGPLKVKGFAYLLGFDKAEPVAATSTQTYGLRATAGFKLSPKVTLNLMASYASQADYKSNPVNYRADYIAAEAGIGAGNLTATAGYELLGADNGRAFQTPMATLHKFNGWADTFLTTPNAGLQDIYGGLALKMPGVKGLSGLNAAVFYHDFQSDVGSVDYGTEWDAQIGFKLNKKVSFLAKYADYAADAFATDTKKFWLQLEYSL